MLAKCLFIKSADSMYARNGFLRIVSKYFKTVFFFFFFFSVFPVDCSWLRFGRKKSAKTWRRKTNLEWSTATLADFNQSANMQQNNWQLSSVVLSATFATWLIRWSRFPKILKWNNTKFHVIHHYLADVCAIQISRNPNCRLRGKKL